jgi:glycerophosphoryl diester phosphodiesterase
MTGRPLIIAHRGASALAYENSPAAFRAAVRLGVDGIELDVHDTADGALVVRHDAMVADRRIADLTLAAVRRQPLPNGEPIPTLAEALGAIGPGCTVFVELKALTPEHDGALFAALEHGPDPTRYHVHAFDRAIIQRLTRARAGLVAGLLSSEYPEHPLEELEAAGATEWWQEAPAIDAALVNRVHEEGCRLYAWTVDDPARARALDALGVDGLCTNDPGRIRAAFA